MTYGYPPAVCRIWPRRLSSRPIPTNGIGTIARPNGRQTSVAVTSPAIVVVTIRTGPPPRLLPSSGRSTQWRRMMTIAASGMRIPNCGLMIAAIVVRTAARSDRPRHRSRTARRRKSVPTASTWDQTALSNQVIGTNRTTAVATSAFLRDAPSSAARANTARARARSAAMAGSLRRDPIAIPVASLTRPSPHST